jgi:hypothetical protein
MKGAKKVLTLIPAERRLVGGEDDLGRFLWMPLVSRIRSPILEKKLI